MERKNGGRHKTCTVNRSDQRKEIELSHGVSLAIAYVDEHLIELEAAVGSGHWSGRARAYTVPQDIEAFGIALKRFADAFDAVAEFMAGADTGIGLIALRFYRTDRAGHIACHVRLATGELSNESRPEEIYRLSVELRTEAWAVVQFARQISEMAQARAGQALLQVEV
jgi:hypothetical protein